ncbi:REST corepressor 2-like isoform X1 [Portunus trituberculatus]|uniref:REST corepressor 2-like isoform X1 n=1 Tax=Portunus trituberculatus TaxID=210409 RepID=UPI001E1CCF4F|nr:REST corepressor 2-like isoform X1 [Portunus trituberculatus]
MVTASNRSSGESKEDKKGGAPSNGHVSSQCEGRQKDGDSGMRVGKAYQAEIPPLLPSNERRPEQCPERALLVWAPKFELNEESREYFEQYIWLAKDKYGYNAEQALGMLFWHRHDLEKATADLANFTPFPDEWTTEDKVLFEQAFQFHGKSFHRIRQMLPDKTIAQLVKYYYLWKKTRQRSSLIDRHARKHTAKLQQISEGVVGDSSGDRSEEDEEGKGGEESKTCSNCTIPASMLNESPKGLQCLTCYNHWKLGFHRKMGTLRPTVGPMKRDKQLIKHKRRPPRGMHINHEDLMAMISSGPPGPPGAPTPGQQLLRHMENEVIALKRQVQINKAQISSQRSKIAEDGITTFRPPPQAGPPKAKWSQEELLLAVQAVRYFGKDFKAIAEIVGNKTENHVRSFFVTYRKRYNLDGVLREWEEEHGPVRTSEAE